MGMGRAISESNTLSQWRELKTKAPLQKLELVPQATAIPLDGSTCTFLHKRCCSQSSTKYASWKGWLKLASQTEGNLAFHHKMQVILCSLFP